MNFNGYVRFIKNEMMRLTLLFALLMSSVFSIGQNIDGKINPILLERMEEHPDLEQSIVVIMMDQADLAPLDDKFRREKMGQKERIKILLPLLKSTAERSQTALIDFLIDDAKIPSKEIRSLWIHSMLGFEAKPNLILSLAARDDVSYIKWNSPTMLLEHTSSPAAAVVTPGVPETGLIKIKADKLWDMGYTGYGTIAFAADTGIQPFHPAYNNRWMGLYGDQNSAWYEYNSSNTLPYECGDHGTHTLGTMVGVAHLTDDTIGVAPQANWVGGPILCQFGTIDNVGAFQWSLDPDNDVNTISDMPTVVNNSWWDPSLQGNDCNSDYVAVLMATEMAGVSIIFACGNFGNDGPSSITAPSNINLSEVNVFAVGNLNGNSPTLGITASSSRGPSTCGGDSSILIKPEVSAPGTNVRSCELDRTYGNKTGTSMAAPHVAGAILLLKEAFPDLLGEDFKWALYLTARDLGTPGEDNSYGMGIIDVKAAFDYLVEQGNTPVPPNTNLDLVGADTDPQMEYCGESPDFTFYVRNAGGESVTSFDYRVSLETTTGQNEIWSTTGTWDGNIGFNEIARVDVPSSDLTNGTYILKFVSENPNGNADPRPLNNALGKLVTINTSLEVNLDVNGFEDATACEDSEISIVGSIDAAQDFYFKWYADYANESLLDVGKSYELNLGDQDVEIFAVPYLLNRGGEQIPTAGEFTTGNSLAFNLLAELTIASVDVFAEETGNRFIQIKSAISGAPLVTKAIEVNEVGINTIRLDVTLEPGSYTVGFFINKPLFTKTENVNYPYNVGPFLTITGAAEEGTYPYFFNWTLERPYGCSNERILISPEGELNMDLGFDLPTDNVYVNESFEINNTTTGAVKYDWLLDGELEVANMEAPQFNFEEPGVYQITMVATNADGCQSSLSQNVVVGVLSSVFNPAAGFDLKLFPNPASDKVLVDFTSPDDVVSGFTLVDNLGRRIDLGIQEGKGNRSFTFEVNDLSPGVYFLEVLIDGSSPWVHKLVVQ